PVGFRCRNGPSAKKKLPGGGKRWTDRVHGNSFWSANGVGLKFVYFFTIHFHQPIIMITRREFIATGVAGVAGASLLGPQLVQGEEKTKRIKQIGFQSWIVRDEIAKDFTGTLRKMRAMGYNSMELCSPPGY